MTARWDYKVIVLNDNATESEARLIANGSAGWELVSVGGRFQDAQYAYLKRPVGRRHEDKE